MTIEQKALSKPVINSALQVLAEMPPVQGDELDILLAKFHESVAQTAADSERFSRACEVIHGVNPHFVPGEYSSLPQADVLANVVAGLYAPLIHAFSKTVLRNVGNGSMPEVLLAPPRDTVPLLVSLGALAEKTGRSLTILTPPITRKTAGIANNQLDQVARPDPLFELMVNQAFNGAFNESGITELETGIYSTTSLKTACLLRELGLQGDYVALKFYGLGPNLSFVHGLLSGGTEWIADEAEEKGIVDAAQIAGLMMVLDSLEELGMQNVYQSVGRLRLNKTGKVEPVIVPVDEITLEIARATNDAVARTAGQYFDVDCLRLGRQILEAVPDLAVLSQQGFPFLLESPIPPMDNKQKHFAGIRQAQVFNYPKLEL